MKTSKKSKDKKLCNFRSTVKKNWKFKNSFFIWDENNNLREEELLRDEDLGIESHHQIFIYENWKDDDIATDEE